MTESNCPGSNAPADLDASATDGAADDRATDNRALRRRSLLTAAGVTGGVLAALGMATPHATAAPASSETPIPTLTLAELRALTASEPDLCLVTDPGQGGLFRAVPGDTESADNNGTVVVTAAGARFRRVYDGPLNVRWFGARGDGETDDAAAIQATIDAVPGENWTNYLGNTSNPAIYFPAGIYAVSEPIVFDPTGGALTVSGDGNGSCITATEGDTTFEALFLVDTTEASRAASWTFHSLYLMGRPRAGGGYRAVHGLQGHFTGSVFRDLFIQAFKQDGGSGINIGYGWSNTIESCRIQHCDSGIRSFADNLNALHIMNCGFSSHNRAAIYFTPTAGGLSIHIRGCRIENNPGAGILVEGSVGNFDVTECYFESNAQNPVLLPDRDDPVHAHIIIGTDLRRAGPIRISDNLVNLTAKQPNEVGSFVVCHSAEGSLTLAGNRIENPRPPLRRSMLSLGRSATPSYHLRNVSISGTEFQRPESCDVIEIDQLSGMVNSLHETTIQGVHLVNYSPLPSDFEVVAPGVDGTVSAASERFRTQPVWEFSTTGVGASQTYGFSIDLDDHPELAERYVYFACTVKAADPSTGVALWTSQLDHQAPIESDAADWHVVSYVDRLPASGTVSFGLQAVWTDASSTLLVTKPVLAELGARYDQFSSISLTQIAGLGRAGFLRALDR